MRWVLYGFTILGIVGLAIWAYGQNHQTQVVNTELRQLRNQISELNQSIDVYQAEWAYLNRPERLIRLADLNFETLRLVPIEGHQFGRIGDIGLRLDGTPLNASDQP